MKLTQVVLVHRFLDFQENGCFPAVQSGQLIVIVHGLGKLVDIIVVNGIQHALKGISARPNFFPSLGVCALVPLAFGIRVSTRKTCPCHSSCSRLGVTGRYPETQSMIKPCHPSFLLYLSTHMTERCLEKVFFEGPLEEVIVHGSGGDALELLYRDLVHLKVSRNLGHLQETLVGHPSRQIDSGCFNARQAQQEEGYYTLVNRLH